MFIARAISIKHLHRAAMHCIIIITMMTFENSRSVFFLLCLSLSPSAMRLELLLFNCSQFDFIFTNRRLLIACNSDTNKQKRKMLNELVRFIDWGGQAWEAIQFHFSMNECRSWYFRCSQCHPATFQYWMARCSQWMNRCQTVHIAGAKFHRTSDRMWCEQSQFVAAVTMTMYLWIVHTCDGDRKTCVVSTVAGPDEKSINFSRS